MTIPNAANCIVEPEKVRDYLLNLSHPAGKGKAAFFTTMGFRQQDWEVLATALGQTVRNSPVTISMTSRHGQKYIVDGVLVRQLASYRSFARCGLLIGEPIDRGWSRPIQ